MPKSDGSSSAGMEAVGGVGVGSVGAVGVGSRGAGEHVAVRVCGVCDDAVGGYVGEYGCLGVWVCGDAVPMVRCLPGYSPLDNQV